MSDAPKKLSESDLYYQTVIKTQQKQLVESNRKINDMKLEIDSLKTEIKHLRSLSPTAINEVNKKGDKLSNEEIIAIQEISKLKDVSDERALDFDEVKKLEVLNKILASKKVKEKDDKAIEEVSNEELLQFLKQAETK